MSKGVHFSVDSTLHRNERLCFCLLRKDGLLKGFILIGKTERSGIYTALIRERTPLDTIDFDTMKKIATSIAFSPENRRKKFGGVVYIMLLNVKGLDYKALNEALRQNLGDITIENCCGQRFIAASLTDKNITINGVPGNALGAYLNGATIIVNANAQDAVGDTMNEVLASPFTVVTPDSKNPYKQMYVAK